MLVAVLAALFGTWLGVPQAAVAVAPTPSSAMAYTYDSHHRPVLLEHMTTDSAPPADNDYASTTIVVDHMSHGGLARPIASAAALATAYTVLATPAQVLAAVVASTAPDGEAAGALSALQRSEVAAKSVPEIKSGIYAVNSADGVYVGQSSNITRRLTQHVASGKFTADEVANAARQGVTGGKTAREIAEQTMIDRMGGIDNLLNLVNPIGPRRFGLMLNQPYIR